MTPLGAETQRLLAIYDAWLACKCGEYERWAEDGAGRCKHERALHYEAEAACELIRSLSERLARVEAETREACAKLVPTNWCDPILTGPRAVFNPNERPEPNVERVLAAVAAAIRAGK